MKSLKIFALALAALSLTACSDDDDNFTYNTLGGVTVEMADQTLQVKENVGVYNVPVKVTGERNGYVRVTIQCTETGENGATANRHFYLTSEAINIPQDSNTGLVEFTSVDTRGFDETRTYNVTIVNVEGGEIGANKTTTVSIIDKGSSPNYNDLAGSWAMTGKRYNDATHDIDMEYANDVNAVCGKPDGNGGGLVTFTGVLGQFTMELEYDYDKEEKYGELVLHYGSEAALSSYIFRWANQSQQLEGTLRGVWNSSYTGATFGNDDTLIYILACDAETNVVLGAADIIGGFTLLKVNEVEE